MTIANRSVHDPIDVDGVAVHHCNVAMMLTSDGTWSGIAVCEDDMRVRFSKSTRRLRGTTATSAPNSRPHRHCSNCRTGGAEHGQGRLARQPAP
jgi:hypothetical protein